MKNQRNTFFRRSLRTPIVFLLLGLPAPAFAQAKPQRIDPAGIEGALLLCGPGDVSQAAAEQFFELAGGLRAKIVVVIAGKEASGQVIDRLSAHAEMKKYPPIEVMRLKNSGENKDRTALEQATGVWLAGEFVADWHDALEAGTLATDCRNVLQKRAGVVGASGAGSAIMGRSLFSEGKAPPALDLLPDALIDVRSPRPMAGEGDGKFHGLVGYQIDSATALLVQGRTIRAIGPGKVVVKVESAVTPPLREITVQGKRLEDLTALRRAARDRLEPRFPPAKVEAPVVEKGTLVIVGGGGSPDGLYKKFVELAGGPDKARIVVFPTANPDPLSKRDGVVEVFRKAGAKHVVVLKGRSLAEVESKEFLDELRAATGLWFDGGRQWRFVDCYEGTKALPLMFDVLKHAGVIGGTSAGATIQGEYLCRGGVFTNFDIRYEGYERGLGFLKGVAIDQHFSQRKRQTEMTALMKAYPQYLGIGLDEATAIIVQGSVADVIGRGKTFFYDAGRKAVEGQPDYDALPAGGRYDLNARKVLEAP
jgi:cyanophycinase